MTHPDSTTNTGAVETLAACPCGRTSSDDNAVQEASVILACIKAGTGSRAYRVECYCGWKGPIETEPYCAITAWNTRATPTPASEAEDFDRSHIKRLHRLQHDGTTPAAKPKWGASIIGWAADEIIALRALALSPTKEHRDD